MEVMLNILYLIAVIFIFRLFIAMFKSITPDDPLKEVMEKQNRVRQEKESPRTGYPNHQLSYKERKQQNKEKERQKQLNAFKYKRQEQLDFLSEAMRPHLKTLAIKRMQKIAIDDYGIKDDAPWKEEFTYFWNNVVKSLPGKEALVDGNELFEHFDREVVSSPHFTECGVVQDLMKNCNPYEYEHLCAKLLIMGGWNAKTTTGSGDQGVDIVCDKNGFKGVLQCKKYSGNVGNKAVQEIHAGLGYYGADFAAVVTNSQYTPSARLLAKSLGVMLLHESQLSRLSTELQHFSEK